jgi:hypothetical protein
MIAILAVAAALTAAPSPAADTIALPPPGMRITQPAQLRAFLRRVPSFSRQTHLACNSCHNGFPQLNAFGRLFKLNGYTLTGLASITAQQDSASPVKLQLSPISPFSVMAIINGTSTASATPESQSFTAEMPQELSLFAASEISPKMGIFSQFTYEDQSGTFGIDNVDIRFADHKQVGDRDVLYGITLHNNPTVQDVWNSSPAWGFPFTASEVAPSPSAATLIDDGLEQSVVGLGAYTLFGTDIYAELTGYVAAPQETALPLDASAENTPKNVAPYWRLALQHQYASTYVMVGTFGMASSIYPSGITGAVNKYTDVGLDAQVEQTAGKGLVIGRASFIHEKQTLTASVDAGDAANTSNTLKSYKLNVSWLPDLTNTFSAGIFGTTGTTDALLYPGGEVSGSRTGSPNSQGAILEYSTMPWLNVRLGAQYIAYQKFNGASSSYDIAPPGRKASDNNTFYLYLWFAY